MMEGNKYCRCCLSQSGNKDMKDTYFWLGEKEIYSEMLQECFNIVMSTKLEYSFICDLCVTTLRESLYFKRQVLQSETELIKRINSGEKEKIFMIDVKTEQYVNSNDVGADHYILDQIIKEESHLSPSPPPVRSPQPPKSPPPPQSVVNRNRIGKNISKTKRNVKKHKKFTSTESSSRSEKKSIKSKDLKSIQNRKMSLKNDIKMKLSWTTHTALEKRKHRDNLMTILKYSNVIPFKNKSLLGFICGYCDATYPDPLDLRVHTENDHEKERLQFKSSFDMTEYNVKLDVTDLSCLLCSEKIDNLTKLTDHLVKIHNKIFNDDVKDHIMQFRLKKGDVFDCAMCPSTYETFKMLKQHMNKHYSNYSCNKCDVSFATKRSLNAHQKTHIEGSYKCDLCEKVFSSTIKRQYHEKTKHFGERNISNCPLCNVPFRSYYQRNQHMVKVHNSEAQYKCNVCNRRFVLKSLLMCHVKQNHLMEKNYQCTECGYKFFSKKALNAHMVRHNGERKYECEVCQKSYARKYTLREHMRIHNNDRRFKCDICGTAFVQKCSLKSHLLSHHGITMAASDIQTS